MRNDMKKYISIGLTAFSVIAASIILFFMILRWKGIFAFVAALFQILAPFLIGIMIAYLINPLFVAIQKGWIKVLSKMKFIRSEEKVKSIASSISSILAIVIVLAVIVAIFSVIVPETYRSAKNIVDGYENNSSNLEQTLKGWIRNIAGDNTKLESTILSTYHKVSEYISNWIQGGALMDIIKVSAGPIFGSIFAGISTVVSMIINTFVAIIVAVYLLNSKKTFVAQSRKVMYGIGGKKCADIVLGELSFAHEVFGRYIRGALADSFILGCVVFIVMTILGLPYALLVAIMVGMTNVIPFFGPYIGGIPSAILILLVSPMDCLKFVIMILIMQQIEGNIISPKIIGNSTGLSGFWVLFSIMFFGSILGIIGLLFGVPLFAVIQHIASGWLDRHLKKKHLPTDTEEYAGDGLVDMIPDEKNIESALDKAMEDAMDEAISGEAK